MSPKLTGLGGTKNWPAKFVRWSQLHAKYEDVVSGNTLKTKLNSKFSIKIDTYLY